MCHDKSPLGARVVYAITSSTISLSLVGQFSAHWSFVVRFIELRDRISNRFIPAGQMQSLAFSSSCELGGGANAAVSILLLLRTDSSVLGI